MKCGNGESKNLTSPSIHVYNTKDINIRGKQISQERRADYELENNKSSPAKRQQISCLQG